MRAFEYASPTTKEQAVSLLGKTWGEGEILAGGTDLLSLMKDDIIAPKRLVNIKEIRDLGGINTTKSRGARSDSDLSIGALVTIQELIDNPQVQKDYLAIVQAAEGITSPQIRNMGTIGGDLCQRPRCWYYRTGFGLLAKDQSGTSLVTEGDNRYHAILDNAGPAYFVSPSSLAPALIAFNARVEIFGPRGARMIPVEKFFRTPQTENEREYDIKPNEIVTRIILPKASGSRSSTYEVRQKEALDWPLATASVSLIMNGNKVRSARIVMGHVAPVPWRSIEAEQALVGGSITQATAKATSDVALSKARALSDNGYKIQLARVAVKRAILQAGQVTSGGAE